ncbi:uncharacterized protein LOC126896825 [Daktulosphaira vitifoliae]|uniref:uncharacterized protein LOC126896825 n=1 Tax=Daktulosphaira vitifoliae TaxID=58002 RepID=UPI0021AAC623|nr:uncharacterized protein LOC126896825 [Daktulosphaira vitifoliae]
MMDIESFYSVCPEILSKHIALRCPGLDVAMDPFCGAGGNVIQLAKRYKHVIAVDIDANKLEFAKRNAEIYGVREKITFIQGDFFEIAETLKKYKPQVIVTSPPWGGPSYKKHEVYSLEKHMCKDYEGGGRKLFDLLRSIAPNVALHIPKTTGRNELIQFGKLFDLNMEIQHNYIDESHDWITAFFGRFFNMKTKFLSNDNKLYSAQDRLNQYKNTVTPKETQSKQYGTENTDMNPYEVKVKYCKERNLNTDITKKGLCTKKPTLKLGETQKIIIVQKRTKTCYLVHSMESRNSVITLCDKLREMENNLRRIQKVEKYDMCLIFFGAEWYRGKIMDETNEGMLKIYLIDIAQTMLFNRKDVYEIPKQFEGESLLIEIVVTPPPKEILTTVYANVEAIKTIVPSTVVKLI